MTDRGTFRAYKELGRLSERTLETIGYANSILAEYEARGHQMTLRQLYYQFVARGLTGGVNTKAQYDRIGNILNEGRLRGLVSWTALEDRGRNLRGVRTYDNIHECLSGAAHSYKTDLWADQQWRPEVWIEKEALVGVIGNICARLRVDFYATKGYNSQSEQWRAGQRFARYVRKGQRPIVFHLGDHDPSGIDMTRDNQERLSMFTGTPVIVQRLALNMAQVEEFNPPPNPTKETDSRSDWYRSEYGDECWELDALEPTYIENLIKESILKVRDEARWDEALQQEIMDQQEMHDLLNSIKDNDDDNDA